MFERCTVCWNEKTVGNPCNVCHNRAVAAEQARTTQQRTREWYDERLKENPLEWPASLHSPTRWGYRGEPEWDKSSSYNTPGYSTINWLLIRMNELYDQLQDLKFELAEKEEAEHDHRCSQCGSPGGRQVP